MITVLDILIKSASIDIFQAHFGACFFQLLAVLYGTDQNMSYIYSNLKELPWSHDHEVPSSHDHKLPWSPDQKLPSSYDHCSFLLSYPAITTRAFSSTFTPVNQYVTIAPFP